MQSAFIPRHLCDEIDKSCRRFLWGETENVRHLHSVSWSKICQPKELGGLSLRTARNINQASLMKAAWDLTTKQEDLWVEVIRSKYKCGKNALPIIDLNRTGSNLWRGVCSAWKDVQLNIIWRLGRGRTINCWNNNWIPVLGKLENYVQRPLNNLQRSLTVADLTDIHGGWDFEKINHCLPEDILQVIRTINPPNATRSQDRIAWLLNKDGEFSTSSAYEYLLNSPSGFNGEVYKLIWKWPGPERVRIHLWKMAQGALITNLFRQRRGMSSLSNCPICDSLEESILHMARDCRSSFQIWTWLAGNKLPHGFLSPDPHDWMINNLRCTSLRHGVEWRIIFGAATTCIWQNRNNKVFIDKVDHVEEICWRVVRQAQAFQQCAADGVLTCSLISQADLTNNQWRPPPFGVWKLNCDGAVCDFGNSASAGGVLRDHEGAFILGFASILSPCNVLEAELHAISMGIKLARLKGARKMEIESDSLTAVRLIMVGCSSNHPLFNLISVIQELLRMEDSFCINHVLRDGNKVADSFAKFGLSLELCSRCFTSVPSFASSVFRADFMGAFSLGTS